MSDGPLSNDDFFQGLAALFEERRKADHGSIYLTQKRLTYGQDTSSSPTQPSSSDPTSLFPDLTPSKPLPILIRATNGKSNKKTTGTKKQKLSTIVEVDALEAFYVRYADVCKIGMSNLKKRDRSKAKQLAKKKKQGGAPVGEVKN